MMKSAVLASLIASAAAFAPSQQKASSTALNMAFESELGAQPPLGFFDPLGLVANGDQAKFDKLREIEIKHGRICMLGFLGQVTTRAGLFLPGNIDAAGNKFSGFGVGFGAIAGPNSIPQEGVIQIIAFIGFLEIAVMKDLTGTGEFVGDFRNGAIDFGWDTFDPATKLSKRAIELNNGRAAMMGLLGLMMHEQVGGTFPLIGDM